MREAAIRKAVPLLIIPSNRQSRIKQADQVGHLGHGSRYLGYDAAALSPRREGNLQRHRLVAQGRHLEQSLDVAAKSEAGEREPPRRTRSAAMSAASPLIVASVPGERPIG